MPQRRPPKRKKLTGPIHGRIAKLRGDRNLSQRELAERVVEIDSELRGDDAIDDLHSTAVSHWEKGQSYPATEILPALAKALESTVDDLIEGEGKYTRLREALAS